MSFNYKSKKRINLDLRFIYPPSYRILFELWLPNDWEKGTADKFDEVSFWTKLCCNGNGLNVLVGLSRCGLWRRDEQKPVVLKPSEVVLVDSEKSADCFIDSFSSDSQIASFSFKLSWCLSHSRLYVGNSWKMLSCS